MLYLSMFLLCMLVTHWGLRIRDRRLFNERLGRLPPPKVEFESREIIWKGKRYQVFAFMDDETGRLWWMPYVIKPKRRGDEIK
ncbi:MAG: hypothetical protein COA47_10330 [Robiginitomaculum sp.]|nr:MAG: hypothetical protein COA47_10330 [Robiginitomaculum sp.]